METPEEYPEFFVDCSLFGFIISDRVECDIEECEIEECELEEGGITTCME